MDSIMGAQKSLAKLGSPCFFTKLFKRDFEKVDFA